MFSARGNRHALLACAVFYIGPRLMSGRCCRVADLLLLIISVFNFPLFVWQRQTAGSTDLCYADLPSCRLHKFRLILNSPGFVDKFCRTLKRALARHPAGLFCRRPTSRFAARRRLFRRLSNLAGPVWRSRGSAGRRLWCRDGPPAGAVGAALSGALCRPVPAALCRVAPPGPASGIVCRRGRADSFRMTTAGRLRAVRRSVWSLGLS